MNKNELLHVLWDTRDALEVWNDRELIARIEAQMDILEQEIWDEENVNGC